MVSLFQDQQCIANCRRWATTAAFQWPSPFWTPGRSRSISSDQQKRRIGWWLIGQKCSSQMKASFVSHLEVKDLECGDYQERRINQAAPNQLSSFPSLSWSGEQWRLVVLDNSVSWSLMLMPKFTSKSLSISCYQAGEEIFGCTNFMLQQDLVPAHSARSTMRWLEDYGIEMLPWPANSPDLNPIENLWGLVKRRMSKERPSTQEELKGAIQRVWNSVTPEDCYCLVSSMPWHIQAVIAATKY